MGSLIRHYSVWAAIFGQPEFLCWAGLCGPQPVASPQASSDYCCCKKPANAAVVEEGCCSSCGGDGCRACCDVARARTTPPKYDVDGLRHWLSCPPPGDFIPGELALVIDRSGGAGWLLPLDHTRRQAGLCVWLK